MLALLHRRRAGSALAAVLAARTELPVRDAVDGDRLRPGVVLVAPPDRHLVVGPGDTLRLTQSAPVRGVRPSADVLFGSLAAACGPRIVAVVLTGFGSDGADGVVTVKQAGGTVLAQDEETSEIYGMPLAAVATGAVDRVLPLGEIAAALVGLVGARAVRGAEG